MPIVQIHILEGRSTEQVAGLIAEITDAVVNSIQVNKEQVRVLVTEVPASHWGAVDKMHIQRFFGKLRRN